MWYRKKIRTYVPGIQGSIVADLLNDEKISYKTHDNVAFVNNMFIDATVPQKQLMWPTEQNC